MPTFTTLDSFAESAIIKAYVAHVPLRDIAHSFHVGHTRIMRLLRAQGVYHAQIPTFDAANAVSQEQRSERDARILALWQGGTSLLDISSRMELTRDLVKNVLRRAGYSFPNASGQKIGVPRCRCCGIVLAESGDGGHEAEEHDGVCYDCWTRYVLDDGRWVRRAGFVLELAPLPQLVDAGLGWAPGWAMLEEDV